MLLYRVLSAIVGIPVIVTAIWFGGTYLLSLIAVLTFLGLKEFYNLTKGMDFDANRNLGYIGGILILLTSHFAYLSLGYVITLLVIGTLIWLVIKFPEVKFGQLNATLMGMFYVGLLFSYLILIRQLPNGEFLLIYLFLLNWTSDTAAYFVGKSLGKNKLAPKVSPKKTIEGSLGGIVGTVIISVFYGQAFLDITIIHMIFIGIIVSVFGQVGDLAESVLKRMAKIKDSGNLIPGHGGVLDRFDSILFTAVLLYLYIIILI